MGDRQANGAAQTEDEITRALPALPTAAPLTQEEPKPVMASDPFPWRILIVLYFVIVSDGMAMQIIVRRGHEGQFSPHDRGLFYPSSVKTAGVFLWKTLASRLRMQLFGAYSFAAFLTSFMIGYLSDLFGRKKLMLVGLCSAAICTLGVVMVPNYWLAVGLRFLAGSTNSNVALSRAVIADITKGQNRVLGFAYLGAAFSFSRLIASIIGGLAAGHYLPFGLLAGNPYALPSLIGTIFNVASFVMALTFIPETLSQAQKNKTKDPKTALVEGIKYIASDSVLRNLILGFALNSVTNGSLILALYVYYTLALDVHGLAFTPAEMGLTFSWFGLCALCFQTLLFERVLKRMKIVRLYGMGLSVMSVSTFAVPTGGLIYWWFGKTSTTQVFSYLHTCVCFIGLAVGFMTCLPVMGTMISNAADAERQGLTQGTNQSIAALFRALGPFVAGSIFSFSVSLSFPFLLFWFLGAVNLACLVLLRALPPHGIARVSEERPAGGHQEMRPLAQTDGGEKEAAAAAAEGRHVEVTANEEEESESAPALEVVRDTDNDAKERN